jgi:aminoglycoside/choline kinase family phosphotransferase
MKNNSENPLLDRKSARKIFLNNCGFGNSDIAEIPGDASFRNYARLRTQKESIILMDAPPEHEDIRPFCKVAEYLSAHNLHAPKIIARDDEQGFLLLEDMGNFSFTNILRSEAPVVSEFSLYKQAVDVLLHLHQQPLLALPAYDSALLDREILLFIDWYAPLKNIEITTQKRQEFLQIWHNLYPIIDSAAANIVVLRDYHADNLLWCENKNGLQKVGLLDFQDAVIGSPFYDLVSLLEDARRDVSVDTQEKIFAYYLENRPGLNAEKARAAYALLGAQRNIKIMGIFARLAKRDNKPRYLEYMPRVKKHLQADLAHPQLLDLKNLMQNWLA